MERLTQQQKNFIDEYIKTVDGEVSARNAGYKARNLKEVANRLLSNNAVVKEMKIRLKMRINSLRVDKGYVIQKLLQIAEFSLEEEEILDKDGSYTGKRKLRDTSAALKALESLCKYLGFNAKSDEGYRPAKIITISNLDDKKI